MKENFDLILFDLDGTITDSGEGITKSVQYALSKFGIEEPNLEKLRKFIDFLKTNEEFETQFFELGDGISVSKRK